MLAHFIEICVFSTPEDDEGSVSKGLVSLLPFDPAQEKVKIDRRSAEGFNDRKIAIYGVTLSKQRHIGQFLDMLKGRLSAEQKELVKGTLESRVDANLYLFIRFDKLRLAQDNQLWVTDCGNCYHLKIGLAPFPRKRELALRIAQDILST